MLARWRTLNNDRISFLTGFKLVLVKVNMVNAS